MSRRAAAAAVSRTRSANALAQGHPPEALAAAAIGAGAAWESGAMGLAALLLSLLALVISWGRSRGWTLSRLCERPRVITVLSGTYIPIFAADMILNARSSPVLPLCRLIVFLLAAEALNGSPDRSHRIVLFGLLLLVAGAAETTEIWFALPLAAFAAAAGGAQLRATLFAHQPAGASPETGGGFLPIAGLVAGSILLGGALFFVIPRFGTGWGRQLATKGRESNPETGLSDSVSLGAVGRVKRQTKVAFTAHVRGHQIDPETIYWRGRTYARWTGDGWVQAGEDRLRVLTLPAGSATPVPAAASSQPQTDMVAEIVVRDDHGAALLAPGQPLWLKTPWNARVMLGEDGCLSGPSGQAPRQYEIGVSRAVKEALPQEEAPEVYLDARGAEPEVIAWARAGAPAGADESGVVRALIEDLSRRPYSLDTRAIDPMHPLASFLAGAPGHCEYFASALALGLRARGIPARVVGGFLGAETSTFDDTLTVRESRAHLWVEAQLPDQGWTKLDPTPAEGRTPPSSWQASLTGSWQALVRGWDSLVIGLDLSDQADLWVRLRAGLDRLLELARSRTVWFTGAAACLAALLTTAWRRRSAGVRRAVAASRVPHLYRRLLQIAARYDLHVLPAETAREFATRAAGDLGEREALALLSALYEREQFGGIPPSHAEEKAAEAALNRIRMAGRRPL